MKRLLSFLTAALLLLTAGCSSENEKSVLLQGESGLSSSVSVSSGGESADLSVSAPKEEENSGSSLTAVSKTTDKQQQNDSSRKNNTSSKQPAADQPVTSVPSAPSYQIAEGSKTAHKALAQTEYHGYSNLSAAEKKLYSQIDAAVYSLNNVIELTQSSLSWDTIKKVFGYYMTDHPQCFWLGRSLRYSAQGTEKQIILTFTDGTIADQYSDGKWTLASRETIVKQTETYQKQIDAVLKQIPADNTAFQKEKAAHDFILRQVSYSSDIPTSAAETAASHLYSAYGALIDQNAVCEGYAKLFQHLCYEMGINCIQVTGFGIQDGEKEPHMWNLVLLDGGWYQVDVTWDDGLNDGEIMYYRYFNITTVEMLKDHIIDGSDNSFPPYPIPNCTAQTYHYYKNYCINVKDNKLSENAEEILRRTLDEGEDAITIVFQDGIGPNLKTVLYGKRNSVSTLLAQVAPSKKLASSYAVFDSYVFVKIL